MAGEAKATFNPFAISRMGADTIGQRTAKATEATADEVKRIRQAVQGGGVWF